MAPSEERRDFDDLENTHHTPDYASERSPHSEEFDAEKSHLLDEGNEVNHKSSWKSHRTWSTRVLTSVTVLNIVLFLTSIAILSSSISTRRLSDQDHWKATSAYSPVFDRFTIPKVTRITNGTFWDTEPPSVWRARTGSDADAAWDAIGNTIQPIIITSSDVRQLGKDPNTAVRAPPELDLGPDAFIAGMDVFHHLHCLDKLRREISYKHYHEATEGPYPGSEMHEAHINHCLDVLQQALRCTGSVDIVTFNWVEGHKLPQPDFNNNKVCRDFEALRGWARENGIAEGALDMLRNPPEGAVILKESKPKHGGA